MELPAYTLFRKLFLEHAGMFERNLAEVEEEFGEPWRRTFDLHLRRCLGLEPERYRAAIEGYSRFSLDFLRLQRRFNERLCYEPQTYEEAHRRVYQNAEYMTGTYLPGIFVSQFLWRHHFR